jgi:tetratricopeptide (TPR) repeat protein
LARIPLGLSLVLTVAMAATRPSSAMRAGSPDSSQWWDTKDFAEFTKNAHARRAMEDFAGLESVYTQGYEHAKTLGNLAAQISYLSNLGTAHMLALRFAPALEAYLQARALAERSGDWSASGGVAVNLALLYQWMGDADSALSALERGKTALDRLRTSPFYKAQLLMSLRSARAELQENPSEPRYEEAIEAARETGDPQGEAAAWDLLGEEQSAAGDLVAAEASLGRALRLRAAYSPTSLGYSYAAMGALRLAQAGHYEQPERGRRAQEAAALTQRAIDLGPPGPPTHVLLHQRGQIREMLDQPELALEDFGTAIKEARPWNGTVPAAISLVTGANIVMQQEIFDSFVNAAARQALRTGNRAWAIEAFVALEANRAASLRESRELAPVWKKRLPLTYWETLRSLNQEEARHLASDGAISPTLERLHLELTEMESTAGVGVPVTLPENFRTRSSLIDIQQGLGERELLLSFYLGKKESYLWAVTRRSIELHRLPAESEVHEDVKRFREVILKNQAAGDKLGADLYRRLFGSLDPEDAGKTSWLLSLDGVLFELPFAALVSRYENGQPVYAAQDHSTQEIPGALFLTRDAGSAGGYLGVGDPIYNSADPRREPDTSWAWHDDAIHGQLNRLVNSGRELERSSATWRADTGPSRRVQILEGRAAQRDVFLDALNASPLTIHLSTHVLTSTTDPEQAFLAFSLDASGSPGLLSTSEVGMQHVPGALIVMTGCATGTGDIREGAGLLGLTRAWMTAGARAVVATNWPVPDANGDLIPAFYQHLRTTSAAEALRRSQVEQIHSGTWQAAPSYWAAFQVTGGGR